jgi:hypothetical protein
MQISGNAFADAIASNATRTIFSICLSNDPRLGRRRMLPGGGHLVEAASGTKHQKEKGTKLS